MWTIDQSTAGWVFYIKKGVVLTTSAYNTLELEPEFGTASLSFPPDRKVKSGEWPLSTLYIMYTATRGAAASPQGNFKQDHTIFKFLEILSRSPMRLYLTRRLICWREM